MYIYIYRRWARSPVINWSEMGPRIQWPKIKWVCLGWNITPLPSGFWGTRDLVDVGFGVIRIHGSKWYSYTGSTIRTLLHGKINPKDWQVLSLGDVGFLLFFRVVSGDYGKPFYIPQSLGFVFFFVIGPTDKTPPLFTTNFGPDVFGIKKIPTDTWNIPLTTCFWKESFIVGLLGSLGYCMFQWSVGIVFERTDSKPTTNHETQRVREEKTWQAHGPDAPNGTGFFLPWKSSWPLKNGAELNPYLKQWSFPTSTIYLMVDLVFPGYAYAFGWYQEI